MRQYGDTLAVETNAYQGVMYFGIEVRALFVSVK